MPRGLPIIAGHCESYYFCECWGSQCNPRRINQRFGVLQWCAGAMLDIAVREAEILIWRKAISDAKITANEKCFHFFCLRHVTLRVRKT